MTDIDNVIRRRLWRAGAAILIILVSCGFLHVLRILTASLTVDPEIKKLAHDQTYREMEDRLLADAENFPTVPLAYYNMRQYGRYRYFITNGCAPFPSVYELEYSNMYWQTVGTSGEILLFGAYFDTRSVSAPSVRLLAVSVSPPWPLYCQVWFVEQPEPIFKRAEYRYIGREDLQPYLLTCELPADVSALRPAAVSLVHAPCDGATNCLRIHFDQAERKQFAVCVKGTDFSGDAESLVKWIESVLLLGAAKIFFYELHVSFNVSKVLAHYQALGLVVSTPITLPGGQPNQPDLRRMYLEKKKMKKRVMEVVPYNDCLYRHMYQFQWLVFLDVDKLILPLRDPNWIALLKRVTHANGTACFSYYLDDQYSNQDITKFGFYDTACVLIAHNPLICLNFACSSRVLDERYARLLSRDCVTDVCLKRADSMLDAASRRLADRIAPRVKHVLDELGLSEPTRRNFL